MNRSYGRPHAEAAWSTHSQGDYWLVAVGIVILATVIGFVCFATNASRAAKPLRLFIVVDTSGSMTAQRRDAVGKLIYAAADRLPPNTEIVMIEYSDTSSKLFQGRPADAFEMCQAVNRFRTYRTRKFGTLPAVALDQVARETQNARGFRTGIILLTDGEDNDRTRTRRVVASLNEKVAAVWVAPVAVSNRNPVEETLRGFGNSLLVSGDLGDTRSAGESFFDRFENGGTR